MPVCSIKYVEVSEERKIQRERERELEAALLYYTHFFGQNGLTEGFVPLRTDIFEIIYQRLDWLFDLFHVE